MNLFRAAVDRDRGAGSACRRRRASGGASRSSREARRALAAYEGREVAVGIRPEDVHAAEP